jgi:hypothetical protein
MKLLWTGGLRRTELLRPQCVDAYDKVFLKERSSGPVFAEIGRLLYLSIVVFQWC